MMDVFSGTMGCIFLITSSYLLSKCICTRRLPPNSYILIAPDNSYEIRYANSLTDKQPLLTAPPEYTPQYTPAAQVSAHGTQVSAHGTQVSAHGAQVSAPTQVLSEYPQQQPL
jgi:hypothetical protein